MNYTNEFYTWILNFLFVIGVLLFLVGLGFMLIPDKLFKTANKLNHWIVTDRFFNKLNAPIYKERFFYRHHQVFGILVLLVSVVCLYMLTFYVGSENITDNIVKLAESEFEKWLFVILYYLLIAAIFPVIIFGLIMFIRPSALKSFEAWGNRWIDTDGPLKILDENKDLPDRILSGNPRIFGLIVTISAIYIIWSTNPF
jgi:cytochrome b561